MSNVNLQQLSNMTGLSPAELARRAEQLMDAKTGKIASLSALDAALLAAVSGNPNKSVQEAFAALGATTASEHVVVDPTHEYVHGQPQGGYAAEPPATPTIGGPVVALEKAAKQGSSRVVSFCKSCTEAGEGGATAQGATAQGMVAGSAAGSAAGGNDAPISTRAGELQGELDSGSRMMQFEQIKLQISRMNEIQNAVTNVMNTMHEQAMTAIRATKV